MGTSQWVEDAAVVLEQSQLAAVLQAGEGTSLVGLTAMAVAEVASDLYDLSLEVREATRSHPSWLDLCGRRGRAEKDKQQTEPKQSHAGSLPRPGCGCQSGDTLATLPGQG